MLIFARQADLPERIFRIRGLLFAVLFVATGVQAANDADLAIVKTVDNAFPQEGDTLVYTLTLTNNGPKNANNIAVSDLLPAGLAYASHVGSGTYDPGTGEWSPGTLLKSGEMVQLAITAMVNAGTAGSILTNTVTVTGSTATDPESSNDSGSVDITVVAPNLTMLKSAQTVSDPVNGVDSPYDIPGATVLYSVQTTNTGLGVPDSDTLVMSDPIPAYTELFVGDLDGAGSGPVLLIDGHAPVNSGLTYIFSGLASATDDLEFSNDNGASWGYTPVPDIDGYDANVTHIRVNPKGEMRASNGTDHPTFTLRFRVRVQ